MIKKYPLECLAFLASAFGIFAWWLSQIIPVVSAWWHEHWLLVTIVVVFVGLGTLAHKWVPPLWRAYVAITDRADMKRIREQHYVMLGAVTDKMVEGYDTTYDNEVHGFKIGVHNPYAKGVTKVQEVPNVNLPLALPGPKLMVDVMRNWDLRLDNLFLASGKGEQSLACSLEGFMHVAHDAPTGLGKTSQFYAEIIQLLKLNVRVILANPHFAPVDKKGNDWRPIAQAIETQGFFEVAPGVQLPGIIRKFSNIAAVLQWLAEREINRRFDMQAEGNYDYEPIYLFIDEWPAIVSRHPEASDYLREILQRGRAVEVCVDTNSQGFLQEDVDLKGSARENFNTAYHMGGSVHSGSKLLDMPIKDINTLLKNEQVTLGKGVALLRNNQGCPQAQLVRLPYAQNDYAYYMLGRADDWMLPEIRSKRAYSGASSSQATAVLLEDIAEGTLEAAGRYAEDKMDPTQFELKKLIADIGKMKANGMSHDAILKQYGLAPGGRNNQNLKAVTEVISELETEEV